MAFRGAVITFPGSNCDRDMAVALEKVSGEPALRVWHGDTDLPPALDFIAVPGGFSYGDYLRCGAIASRSPVMRAVAAAAQKGVPVLGVCNGFQVLTEAGMLPGALMRNAQLTFTCRPVPLRVETSQSLFTAGYEAGQTITLPNARSSRSWAAAMAGPCSKARSARWSLPDCQARSRSGTSGRRRNNLSASSATIGRPK